MGPTLTCQRLPYNECDVTEKPMFLDRLQDYGSATVKKMRENLTSNKNWWIKKNGLTRGLLREMTEILRMWENCV